MIVPCCSLATDEVSDDMVDDVSDDMVDDVSDDMVDDVTDDVTDDMVKDVSDDVSDDDMVDDLIDDAMCRLDREEPQPQTPAVWSPTGPDATDAATSSALEQAECGVSVERAYLSPSLKVRKVSTPGIIF